MKINFKNKRVIFCAFLVLLFLLSLILPVFSYGDTEIRINVPSRTLQLYKSGKLIKEYPVGVGSAKATMTPPGRYKVDQKILNPIWEHPYKAPGESRIGSGEKNPLGTRWIGFHAEGSGVYGIHGTNQPGSVGHFVSHGCVRMHNNEVEDLFEIVETGTPVVVTYNRYNLSRVGNSIMLEVFPDPYGYKAISAVQLKNEIYNLDPSAQIDNELISQAVKDTSEKSIYEVASHPRLAQQAYRPQYPQGAFSDPYVRPRMVPSPYYPPMPALPPLMGPYYIYSSQQTAPGQYH
jgi:hypothetical protein